MYVTPAFWFDSGDKEGFKGNDGKKMPSVLRVKGGMTSSITTSVEKVRVSLPVGSPFSYVDEEYSSEILCSNLNSLHSSLTCRFQGGLDPKFRNKKYFH